MTLLPLRPPLPRSLYLETTSRCNSLCETCILTFGGREPQKDLTWPEFRTIVDQFPALDRVLLHGIGEPLLNRDLPRMVAHLKARGATVLFNSNAITLGARLGRALIDAGLDELRVSLDATTPETYARVRGVDAFAKVVANLERFAGDEAGARASHPKVSLWFTALRDNIDEIPGLVPLAQRVEAAGIHLQRLVYNGLGLATAEQSLFGRLREREAEVLQGDGGGGQRGGHRLRRVGGRDPGGQPDADPRRPAVERVPAPVEPRLRHRPRQRAPRAASPPSSRSTTRASSSGTCTGSRWRRSGWGGRYLDFRSAIQTAEPPEPCRGCGVHWSL